MRALPALLIVALLVAGAVIVADHPGRVAIVWQGWRIDTSVTVMVLGTALIAVVAAALYNLLRRIFRAPRAILHRRRERRRQSGYRALTQGMVAVAAGDAAEALKLARKADVLLAEPPLTLLLSAQAAQLNGDEQAAKRYFTAMLDRAETEFLGLRGLIMQALRANDEGTALHLTERAKRLRPGTPWVATALFDLQTRAGRWNAAEATLIEATRRKSISAADGKHRRAVVLHEAARTADAEGRATDAVRLGSKAQALEPGFAPIAVSHARRLMLAGQTRHARKTLEAAWRAEPHPEIAEAYGSLYADEPELARLKHIERLGAAHPEHAETRIALARAALNARLWGEARRHLAATGAAADNYAPLPPRLCRLLAELEDAEHGDQGAAQAWRKRAAAMEASDPAYVCSSCGGESGHWAALCPRCRAFDALRWRAVGQPAPAPLALATTRMPAALPVLTPLTGSGD